MDAVIVDLKDFAVRTPEQAVRVFYGLYSAELVKEGLLKAFLAVAGNRVPDEGDREMAMLFDHLNALVAAIEALRAGKATDGSCVVCKGIRA